MRSISLTAVAAIVLASCASYEGVSITGRWKDLSREDIAAAVAAARSNPHLKRRSDTLREVDVISHDKILLIWTSKEIDTMERVRGKWQCGITRITVG